MAKILCLDDDKDCLTILRGFLMTAGHEVLPLLRGDRAIAEIKDNQPDLVTLDVMMPGVSGGTIYHAIRAEISKDIPIIISSGSKLRLKFPEDPMLETCPKPVDMDQLLATVERLMQKKAALGEGGGEPASA